MKSINQNTRKIVVSGIILATAILFWGCAAHMASYGRNRISSEAREKFESYQVIPGYSYYYIGSNVNPDAIIAVDNSYNVASAGIWIKVEPASKDIRYYVETMQRNILHFPYGYEMLDPKGELIGFYYSKWDPWPVRMEGENEVWIYPPDKYDKSTRNERDK